MCFNKHPTQLRGLSKNRLGPFLFTEAKLLSIMLILNSAHDIKRVNAPE